MKSAQRSPKASGSRKGRLALEMVEETFREEPRLTICRRRADRLSELLDYRGYNFFQAFLSHAENESRANPVLLTALLSDRTLDHLSEFSLHGLNRWFGHVRREAAVLFHRQGLSYKFFLMPENGPIDVERYKANTVAVDLADVKESVRMFCMATFDQFLVIEEAADNVPRVSEGMPNVFLPARNADFETRESNEMEYYLSSGHECAHKHYGSFEVRIRELRGELREEGIEILENDGKLQMKKGTLVKGVEMTKDLEGESMAAVIDLIDHGRLLHLLWNMVEDLRIDVRRMNEKSPGHKKAFQYNRRIRMERLLSKFQKQPELERKIFAMEMALTYLAAADDPLKAMRGLSPGWIERITEREFGESEEERMLAMCRSIPQRYLRPLKDLRGNILQLIHSKEGHSTESWRIAFGIFRRLEQEKISLQEIANLARNELLMGGMESPVAAERVFIADAKDQAKPEGFGQVTNGPLEEEKGVNVVRLPEADAGTVQLDQALVLNSRSLLLRIRYPKRERAVGALHGHENPRAKRRWKSERKAGAIKPREYHYRQVEKKGRSVAMLSIGDASGSTFIGSEEESVNQVIVKANNSMADATHGIENFSFAYGFFCKNLDGRTHYFEGMGFGDELRRTTINPRGYNVDHEIIRYGGDILRNQKARVRILVLTLDSMSSQGHSHLLAVDAVRRELQILREAGVIPYVITLPPQEAYYRGAGFDSTTGYLDYIYGRGEYRLIQRIGELSDAWTQFIQLKSHLFR